MLLLFIIGLMTGGKLAGLDYLIDISSEEEAPTVVALTALIQLPLAMLFVALSSWFVKHPWLLQQGVGAGCTLLSILFVYIMPESPRHLYNQGRYRAAKEAL